MAEMMNRWIGLIISRIESIKREKGGKDIHWGTMQLYKTWRRKLKLRPLWGHSLPLLTVSANESVAGQRSAGEPFTHTYTHTHWGNVIAGIIHHPHPPPSFLIFSKPLRHLFSSYLFFSSCSLSVSLCHIKELTLSKNATLLTPSPSFAL